MGTVRFRGFGMQFHVEATKNNTRRFRACLRHLPDYCSRSQGIWSQASRVFVPFGLLPVSVGCSGGRYRSKPRAAGNGLPATCLRELCQPPACVSIALAHRYAVRLLVGWSCPRLCSLAVIIVYYMVNHISIDMMHKVNHIFCALFIWLTISKCDIIQ